MKVIEDPRLCCFSNRVPPKEMEVNGGARDSEETSGGGAPASWSLEWSLPSRCGWASVTHKGITVILLTLTLELLLKDRDCSGRFIENGPDFPRSPRLATVPKVS